MTSHKLFANNDYRTGTSQLSHVGPIAADAVSQRQTDALGMHAMLNAFIGLSKHKYIAYHVCTGLGRICV